MAEATGERGKAGERREATRALLAASVEGLRSGEVAERLKVSRQAAYAHLNSLVRAGLAERVGRGRGTRYRLVTPSSTPQPAGTQLVRQHFTQEDPLDVDEVLSAEPFGSMSDAAAALFAGALSRMERMARAREPRAELWLEVRALGGLVDLLLSDSGEGAFAHERRERGLVNEDDARLALSRAADDSDWSWLQRAADMFSIESGELSLRVDNLRSDISLGRLAEARTGSRVSFAADPLRPMRVEALEQRLGREAHALVRLFEHGEAFPSREEARQLMAGLEACERVVLDFGGVREVGEAFAREIFASWARAHPSVRVECIRMHDSVAAAILRAHRDA